MLVVVILVGRVAVPVVRIIDVITVGHGNVSAALAVRVVVPVVRGVLGPLALVEMVVVRAVQMPVVRVVDVPLVRHGDMSAAFTVSMVMAGVFLMGSRH